MNSDEVNPSNINLQTQSRQYDKPSTSSAIESKRKVPTKPLMTPNGPSQIPQPKVETIPKIPKGPLHCNEASNRVSHTHSVVDDLPQSPNTMSTLEVLQSFPSQKKALLIAFGAMDPFDDRLIIFSVDTLEHLPLPSFVAFGILVRVRNAIISRCIIDEGTSTYVMSIVV